MDITLCTNKQCPSCEECYRFKAPPNPFVQAYAELAPEYDEDKCEYFWEIPE